MSRARARAGAPVGSASVWLALSALLSTSCGSDSRPPRAECVGDACTATLDGNGAPSSPGAAGASFTEAQANPTPGATAPELDGRDGAPLTPPVEPMPNGAALPVGPTPREAPSTAKLDLLLVIDNFATMGDKQELLSRSLPALVQRLIDPQCMDERGRRSLAPAGQGCSAGSRRVFAPIEDINVAVISSSLGDAGAGAACVGGERDERAHSIATLSRGDDLGASAAGVLELRSGGDVAAFTASLSALVDAVGQGGCDWNMPLEAMYRFLADPDPYLRLERGPCASDTPGDCVRPAVDPNGLLLVDEQLLAQRAAFLRPDSELAVVLLSDENDCSVQLAPQSHVVLDTAAPEPMTLPSDACELDPNDPCCRSCAAALPQGCAEDFNCDDVFGPPRLDPSEDLPSLRCFEQKRRFGVDYLYPTQRYVNALSQFALCPERPDLDAAACLGSVYSNPLFIGGRDPASVVLGGIVGVPWQRVRSTLSASGDPLPGTELRFKRPTEYSEGDWALLTGASRGSPPAAPLDPFLVESTFPRYIPDGNPINGRDYALEPFVHELQATCLMPLPEPRDCARAPTGGACECSPGAGSRPVCEAQPGTSLAGTTQYWAKALPSLRQLVVLRDHGANAAVTSICARNTREPELPDYGYRPALMAVLERLEARLARSGAAVD